MDNSLSTYCILAGLIGLVAWIGYLDWKISSLEAKLGITQFQLEKDANAKKVDAMPKSELDADLAARIRTFGNGPGSTL